jgi:hypothetical protein
MKTAPKAAWLAAALALLARLPAAASHIPIPPQGVVETQGRLQVTADLGRLDPLLEVQGRLEDPSHELGFRAVTLGGYYRLHRNLKMGAFYRLQWGARHDDDWISSAPTWWEWQETGDRLEQVLVVDVSPRFLLPFLPGRDWVFQLKSRYALNTWNLQQSLQLRPELTYFLLVDRRPVLNLSLAYGLYFPLNFGGSPLYEHAPYVALLYHVSPAVQLELSGSYRTVFWSMPQAVIDAGEPPYPPVEFRAWVVGLGVLLRVGR